MRTTPAVLALVVLALPATALAADAGANEADELARSIVDYQKDAEALSADDCSSACKALASMRRATERLCALEPGPRCDEARGRLEQATNRVRRACPQCAVSTEPPRPEMAPAPARESVATASAPPSESRRGGCAGCTTTGTTSDLPAWVGIGLAALVLRRRRQEPRTSSTATVPPRT